MANGWTVLLDALRKGESTRFKKFLSLSEKNASTADDFSFAECLQSLPKKKYSTLWQAAAAVASGVIASEDHSSDDDRAAKFAVSLLDGVTALAMAHLSVAERKAPPPLFELSSALHDILFTLSENGGGLELQNHISQLCELWWSQKRPSREQLVPQTISYVLIRSLQDDAKAADVKRVHDMRESLQLLDLDCSSSDTLKHLMLRAMTHPLYLRQSHGRRLLSYLFTLHEPFVEQLHLAIKNQIPSARQSLLQFYGEVYFRAWHLSSGPTRLKLEYTCLQDLMQCAVHAAVKSTAQAVRRVLLAFHDSKRKNGVDELLCRLYAPILWRSLKVANAGTRCNATHILADVFPVRNPENSRADNEKLLQKQFDHLDKLLADPDVTVRVAAVHCTSRILGVYWELIPIPTIKALLVQLVSALAFDSSSAAVRAAVFQGLAFMLDNHLSHALMKTVLPQLAVLIHDKSESVRAAFVDLLLVVKDLRAINCFDIVSVDVLLTRLCVESRRVRLKITQLLLSSYFPHVKKGKVQLSRAWHLINKNAAAARIFFSHVGEYAPVAAVCKLVVLLHRRAVKYAQKAEAKRSNDEDEDEEEEEEEEEEHRAGRRRKSKAKSAKRQKTKKGVPSLRLIECLLCVTAELWDSIAHALAIKGNSALHASLVSHFEEADVKLLLNTFTSERARLAVLSVANRLPADEVKSLQQDMMPEMLKLPETASADTYGPMIDCMIAWGKADDVLEMIVQGLTLAVPKKTQQRRSKRLVLSPNLALHFLCYMMERKHTRDVLLSDHAKVKTDRMTFLLGKITQAFREVVSGNDSEANAVPQYFAQILPAYCKLLLHQSIHAPTAKSKSSASSSSDDDSTVAPPGGVVELLDFISTDVLPLLGVSSAAASGAANASKRKKKKKKRGKSQEESKSGADEDNLAKLRQDAVMFMAKLSCELVTTGQFTSTVPVAQVASWLPLLLDTDTPEFLGQLVPVLQHFAVSLACAFPVDRAPPAAAQRYWVSINAGLMDLECKLAGQKGTSRASIGSNWRNDALRWHKDSSSLPVITRLTISPLLERIAAGTDKLPAVAEDCNTLAVVETQVLGPLVSSGVLAPVLPSLLTVETDGFANWQRSGAILRFLSSVRCIAEEQFAKRQKALDAAFSAVRRGIDLCYTNLADENTADNQVDPSDLRSQALRLRTEVSA